MMPRDETMAAIMRLNPSVDESFLSEFSDSQLSKYLGRLYDVADSDIALTPAQQPGAGRAEVAGAVATAAH